MPSLPITDGSLDPWAHLRRHTAARIALGRSGGSLPTGEVLSFALAHAAARDAVLSHFDSKGLVARLSPLGETLEIQSAASSRIEYIARPDLGRHLSHDSARRLDAHHPGGGPPTVIILVCDGLSPLAAERYAPEVVSLLAAGLGRRGVRVGPICVATHARVALQDDVGERLGATVALSLIGERPGLGVADSLGASFIHGPRRGRTDADRNCVSNIRKEGLRPALAAERLESLIAECLDRGLSGTALKERPSSALIN